MIVRAGNNGYWGGGGRRTTRITVSLNIGSGMVQNKSTKYVNVAGHMVDEHTFGCGRLVGNCRLCIKFGMTREPIKWS